MNPSASALRYALSGDEVRRRCLDEIGSSRKIAESLPPSIERERMLGVIETMVRIFVAAREDFLFAWLAANMADGE